MNGYTIIDADTHVTETPDVWTSRAPAQFRDRVPRIETTSKGLQRWVLGNNQGILANPGMTATAGRGECLTRRSEACRIGPHASGTLVHNR